MKTLRFLIPMMVAATAFLVACGGDSEGSSDNDATPTATATARATQVAPAATATTGNVQAPPTEPAAPTATPPAQPPVNGAPTQAAPPPAPTSTPVPQPPVVQPQALTIAAKGTKFIPTQLTALAGSSITITFDNQDNGIAHDLIVYSPSGAIAAQTHAFAGPAQQSTTFTPAAPGNYFFKCSLHPLAMTGAINIQ